jgi:hypothetical protein
VIGSGYKCDQCGYLEVDAVYVDRYRSLSTPPKGWLVLYVMSDENRGQSTEAHHFCSGKCARLWVFQQEAEGKIRTDLNPPGLKEGMLVWGPAGGVSFKHNVVQPNLCKGYGCVPYTGQDK